MKQITIAIFLIITTCFIALFAYTNKQTVLAHSYPSIKAQGICSLSIKRRLSIHCEPDLTTANCKRLPQQKCPLTKIKKLKNMAVSTEQISLAKHLLKTPQNASIMIIIPTRGRAKIKQITINGKTLHAP